MLSNNLRELRMKKGVSQLELSRVTKIAPSSISTIENGKMFPYAGWRRRISEALGYEEKEIFPEVEEDVAATAK